MRTRWILLVAIAVVSFFGGGWLLKRGLLKQNPTAASATPIDGTVLFQQVLRHVRSFAVDSLGDPELYRRAAAGMLEELDDPYAAIVRVGDPADSVYQNPPLGLYLDWLDGAVVVVAAVPGSSGAEAGIRAGDYLLRVGEKRTTDLRPELVARMLKGEPSTEVSVRIRRPSEDQPRDVRLVRHATPPAPLVEDNLLDASLSYIRLFRITDSSALQVRSRLEAQRQVKGVILDLRGTVEGTLGGALALVDPFLDRGATVVTTKGRYAPETHRYQDSVAALFPEVPLVVLVDRGTSGPAEVVAGALQDHDRALLIGEPTFGRGTTQQIFPLESGLALRLSTSVWVTPAGRTIQRSDHRDDPDGTDSLPERPKFKTDDGRTVRGGGGIVPDRLVEFAPDERTDRALALAKQLLGRASNRRTLLALANQP